MPRPKSNISSWLSKAFATATLNVTHRVMVGRPMPLKNPSSAQTPAPKHEPATRGSQNAAARSTMPGGRSKGLRIQRLESQLRQLTGQNEELQYRNRQLEERLRQLGAAPQAPGGLFDLAPSDDLKIQVLATCAGVVANLATQCQSNGSTTEWFETWGAYDALAEREVALYHEHREIVHGMNVGVADDGALLLRPLASSAKGQVKQVRGDSAFDESVQRFEIGEVSLRTSSV